MYDAGLYDPLEEEDQVRKVFSFQFFNYYFYCNLSKKKCFFFFLNEQDFCDFMQEMISMMNNVKDEVVIMMMGFVFAFGKRINGMYRR